MKHFIYFALLMFYTAGCSVRDTGNISSVDIKTHSLLSELSSLLNLSSLPEYISNSYCAQISSWDTTGKNDDGFSGTYSYLRKNIDGSLVIFDVVGSGVINRIWTPTPNNDTLDFYLDNNSEPAFSISFTDLFSGRVYPFVLPLCGNQLGGYYCYIPITFNKSCRIITRGKKIQFHQIQYRLYNDGMAVSPFSLSLDKYERESLEKINRLWNMTSKNVSDFYQGEIKNKTGEYILQPGSTESVFENKKGGRILGIEISPPSVFEGLEKDIDIRIKWDNEKTPAVYCPVADFFGYAFGSRSMQSLLLGSTPDKNYCYFPMPFDNSVKIELISRKKVSDADKIKVSVWYSDIKREPEREGKFYVYRNRNIRATGGVPHLLADIKGKGHYAGTILQAQGLKAGMTLFFEGDDSTSVDDTFSMHGTGSEDYFNGGWYAMLDRWDGRMSLPLHGSLDYSLPFCRTGGYRLFIGDKISFGKSLFHSIEHGPVGNAFPVDYTSLGIYYCSTPAVKDSFPSEELTNVFIPDTLILYPQLIELTLFGSIDIMTTWQYGTGGESYRFTPAGNSWIRMSLRDIPSGSYKIYYDIMTEPDGCDFSVWYRQSQLTDWISGFSKKEERNMKLYICDMDLNETKNTITTRFRTGEGKTSLLLNRIMLIRKP